MAQAGTRTINLLIFLIGAMVFLNYVDRGAMGIAAPLLKADLHLSATQYGLASSAFFYLYAPCHAFAGWLADRVSVYRLLTFGLLIWALATILMGFVGGFGGLIALRLLLGLGESVAFPGGSKLIARHVPAAQRGFANAVLGAGLAFGPAAGTLAGGVILASMGWRPIFLIFGVATLVWLLPWKLVTARLASEGTTQPETPYPFGKLVRHRELWLSMFGQFIANWGLYFTLTWLPLYLVQTRGLPILTMTWMVTATYCANGVVTLIGGRWSDAMIARGWAEARVRRGLMIVSQAGFAVCIMGTLTAAGEAALWPWLLMVGVFAGLSYPNLYGIAQIFAGARASGSWIGMQNGVGNLAGIIGPTLIGVTIDASGSYNSAFILSAALAAAGVVVWALVVPAIREVVPQG